MAYEQRRSSQPRGSEIVVRLPCVECQASIVPVETKESLSFFCDNGHETTLDRLLEENSEAVSSSLEALLAAWHKNAMALELIVTQARSKGHDNVVGVFQRHISTLEKRIELLKRAVEGERPPLP